MLREREKGELGGDASLRLSWVQVLSRASLFRGGLSKGSLRIGQAWSREGEGEELRGYASLSLSRLGLEPGDEGREDERGRYLVWACLRAYGICAVLRTVLGFGALGKEGLLDVLEEGRGRW